MTKTEYESFWERQGLIILSKPLQNIMGIICNIALRLSHTIGKSIMRPTQDLQFRVYQWILPTQLNVPKYLNNRQDHKEKTFLLWSKKTFNGSSLHDKIYQGAMLGRVQFELNRKITKRNSDENKNLFQYPREHNAQQIYNEGIKRKRMHFFLF